MGLWGKKKKTRKNLVKHDIQQTHDVLDYINHTALKTAGMGAEYKKRLMMEGDENDKASMDICDAVTIQLKGAYETMFELVKEKQNQPEIK